MTGTSIGRDACNRPITVLARGSTGDLMHHCLLIMPRVVLVISCIDYLMYRAAQWRAMDGALAHGYFLHFRFPTDMACEHES